MLKALEMKKLKGGLLTLDDVARFVQLAMRDGAEGTAVVEARISFGGKLQALKITIDTDTTKE